MKPHRLLVFIGLLLLLIAPNVARPSFALFQSKESCGEIVQKAFEATDVLCEQTGRNEVCYGHKDLEALPDPNVTDFNFDEEGDIADVAHLRSLRLSALDVDTQAWGVALMRLQGSIQADENLTLLVFGDVELENRVTASTQIEVTAIPDRTVNLRELPGTNGTMVGTLAPGQTVVANGRLADSSWVRVELPDGRGYGWVFASLLVNSDDIEVLDVIDKPVTTFGAMHAFYFQSSIDDSSCEEAPSSGILIQTPEGIAEVSLLINEVDIRLGSTVYLQAQAGEEMIVRVVEGSAQVEAFGVVEQAAAGYEIRMPLTENLAPANVPAPAEPYEMPDVEALPVELLEREITVHPPGDEVLPTEEAEVTETPVLTEEAIDELSPEQTEEPPLPTEEPEITPTPTEERLPTADATEEPTASPSEMPLELSPTPTDTPTESFPVDPPTSTPTQGFLPLLTDEPPLVVTDEPTPF